MDMNLYIKQNLYLQGLPAYETDLPYIHHILRTIHHAETSLNAFPFLNEEKPITVVDRRLLR